MRSLQEGRWAGSAWRASEAQRRFCPFNSNPTSALPFPAWSGSCSLFTSPLLSGADTSFPNGCPGFCLCAPTARHTQLPGAPAAQTSPVHLASLTWPVPPSAGLPGADGWPRPGLQLRRARLPSALQSPSGWLPPTPCEGRGAACRGLAPLRHQPPFPICRVCRWENRVRERLAWLVSRVLPPETAQNWHRPPGMRPLTGGVSLVAAI